MVEKRHTDNTLNHLESVEEDATDQDKTIPMGTMLITIHRTVLHLYKLFGGFLDFVLGFFVPLKTFSLIRRCQHYRLEATHFYLCLAIMATKSVYNGHLGGPVTHTCCRFLESELSLPVLTNYVCPHRGTKPDLPHTRRTLYHYATAANWIRWSPCTVSYWHVWYVQYTN